jgi:hypothetical protein
MRVGKCGSSEIERELKKKKWWEGKGLDDNLFVLNYI